jgi:hypothetical protein
MARRGGGGQAFLSRACLFIYGKAGGSTGWRPTLISQKARFGQICKVSMCHVIFIHALGGRRPIITNSSLCGRSKGVLAPGTRPISLNIVSQSWHKVESCGVGQSAASITFVSSYGSLNVPAPPGPRVHSFAIFSAASTSLVVSPMSPPCDMTADIVASIQSLELDGLS